MNDGRIFTPANQSLPLIKHADLFNVYKMGNNHKLEELNKFHQSIFLPGLLKDVDLSHSRSYQNLPVGAIIIFKKGTVGAPRKKKGTSLAWKNYIC